MQCDFWLPPAHRLVRHEFQRDALQAHEVPGTGGEQSIEAIKVQRPRGRERVVYRYPSCRLLRPYPYSDRADRRGRALPENRSEEGRKYWACGAADAAILDPDAEVLEGAALRQRGSEAGRRLACHASMR